MSKAKIQARIILLFFFLFLFFGAAQADDYYVDASTTEGNVVGDGSESDPWQTISHAITIATLEGDIIHVASGEYKSSMSGSSESFPLSIPNGVHIIGPGVGIATVEVVNGDAQNTLDLVSNCTLEGIAIKNDDPGEYSVYITGENNLITGCTIECDGGRGPIIDGAYNRVTGCTITTTVGEHALEFMDDGDYCTVESNTINAGYNKIYCRAGAVNTTVRNNTMTGNYGLYFGGGCHNASIEGNTITVSSAGQDGIHFYQSAAAADNITIFNNKFIGPSNTNSSTDCLRINAWGRIASNEVRNWYYAINIRAADSNTLNIENNTIVKCAIGVYNDAADGTVNVKNNIIAPAPGLGSTYIDDSIAINNTDSATFNSTFNCLFNNEEDHAGTIGTLSDNIFSCPRFYDVNNDDYRLYSDSPCLTAGEGGGRMGRYGSAGVASQIKTESWASPGGTGDGTQGSPWSLTAAVTLTTDTIYVTAGTYNPGAGESFPIELGNNRRMVGTGEVIIDEDSETNMSTVNMGSYSTVEGIKVKNNNSSAYAAITPCGKWNLIDNCTVEASGAHLIYDRYAGSGNGGDYNRITNNSLITTEGDIAYPVTFYGDFCTVESNTFVARVVGPAIDLRGAGPHVKDNSITGIAGNGISFTGANASIEANTITLQTAGTDGIYSSSGANYFYVFNNKVVGASSTNGSGDGIDLVGYGSVISNEVSTFGNGIDAHDPSGGDIVLDRNTVVKCETGVERSGSLNTVYVKNCIVSSQPEGGSGLSSSIGVERNNGAMIITYSNVYGNETDYDGDPTTGDGTISAIAQFADVGNDDYHLNYNSPCIDSGDPVSEADPDGTRADMGAYPFYQTDFTGPSVEITSPTGSTKWKGGSTQNITWTLADESGIKADSVNIFYTLDNWNTTEIITTEVATGEPYAWTIPGSINTDEAKVRVTAEDNAPAHSLGTAESSSFIIDSTSPSSPVLETPPNDSSIYNTAPTFTWQESTDNLSDVANYEIKIDDALVTQDATASYTPSSPLSNGLHTWEVRSKDGAGNWGEYSSAFEFTLNPASTFLVYNCNDSGPGSLRYVLSSVEAGSEVVFDISMADAGYSTGETYSGLVTNEAGSNKWFRIMINSTLPSIEVDNVYIHGSTQTREAANTLGPSVEVRCATGGNGFVIDSAEYCTIEGLVINNFTSGGGAGIFIGNGGSHNRVVNCYVGVQANGTSAKVNVYGIHVSGDTSNYNIIGGAGAGERNIIGGNGYYGVFLDHAGSNEVRENYVGLGRDGDTIVSNGIYGVYAYYSSYNTIESNVISGQGGAADCGIRMSDSDHNRIKGNKIGTNTNGTAARPNYYGIRLTNGQNNVIGGTTEAERNIISGNTDYAIRIGDSYNNYIKGNFLGLDVNGTSALGNGDHAIFIEATSYNNVIGGTTEGERNIISNNGYAGIFLSGEYVTSNEVIGNYIGTDVNGTAAMGNTDAGVAIVFGSYNKIGGLGTGKGNIICDTVVGPESGGMGIVIYDASSNEVIGNKIGKSASGGDLGNAVDGVIIAEVFPGLDSAYNQIGPNNEIAYNGGDGVHVMSTAYYNLITRNSMEANAGKGISLEAGANNDIPYPVITSAVYTAGQTTLTGTSTPDATIEIFKTETTPEAQGEGKVYLGTVTAESNGSWEGTVSGLIVSDRVTATASLFSSQGDTSEFAINGTVESEGGRPVVLVITPNGAEKWRGGATHAVTWTAADESGIDEIRIYYTSGEEWIEIASGEANDGTYDWLTPSIDTSEALVSIEAVDSSDNHNLGSDKSSTFFSIDSTKPLPPILVTPPDGNLINDSTPTLTWEASTDNLTAIASYEIDLDDTLITQDASASHTSGTPLSEGMHTWEVRAKDGAGNWGSFSSASNFVIDLTAPELNQIDVETDPGTGKVDVTSSLTLNFSEAMDSDSVENSFTISPEAEGEFSWEDDFQTLIFTPTTPFSEGTSYTIRIEAARDISGNPLPPLEYEFTTQSVPADSTPPEILIQIAGLTIKSGDYIGQRSKFDVYLTDDLSLDATSAKVTLDDNIVTPVIELSTPASMEMWYRPDSDLEEGSHTLKVEIKDTAGNPATKEANDLKVSYGSAKVVGPVLCFPTTFSPGRDGTCTIAYHLNRDVSTTLYIYGPAGEIFWTRKFSTGENGGKAGYNAVEFNGVSDINGSPLANGIYVLVIAGEGKLVGKGHIVIYE